MKASRPAASACFCRTASKRASRFRIDNLPVTVTFVPPQPEPSATRRFIRVLGLINVGPTRLLVLLQSGTLSTRGRSRSVSDAPWKGGRSAELEWRVRPALDIPAAALIGRTHV